MLDILFFTISAHMHLPHHHRQTTWSPVHNQQAHPCSLIKLGTLLIEYDPKRYPGHHPQNL